MPSTKKTVADMREEIAKTENELVQTENRIKVLLLVKNEGRKKEKRHEK